GLSGALASCPTGLCSATWRIMILTKLRFENHKRKPLALFQKRSEFLFETRLHFHFFVVYS
ncbi:MAG: hypothetical protein WBN52_17025, partial [Eudoraea sp.]|uniref:hypothetical protein n=1 Tax=Eudoraea sp. TaxID=1979955 RepID=UPI003C7224B6